MDAQLGSSRQLHKFGGSSLADAVAFRRTANILRSYSRSGDLVVVSAAGKTTDHLFAWTKYIEKDGRLAHDEILWLRQYQSQLIESLFTPEDAQPLLEVLYAELSKITALGDQEETLSAAKKAWVIGHGEYWSHRILSAYLNKNDIPSVAVDAREFLRCERAAIPEVDEEKSRPLLQIQLQQHTDKHIIIPGFIAQNDKGHTVLLGRKGSDYSATMIGALANVSKVTLWHDVAGVHSADPRLVSDACLLPLLRLDEASELARLALPVLHMRALQPVANSEINLTLRSCMNPSSSTQIARVLATGRGAKTITSRQDISVIHIKVREGVGLESVRDDIRHHLEDAQLLPLTFEVQPDIGLNYAYTEELAPSVFEFLQELDLPIDISLHDGFSMIAAVGSGVGSNPIQTHGFYSQIKSQPVEFVSNGDNAISLIAVLRGDISQELLEAMHSKLFQTQKRVGIIACGKGKIGGTWIKLFAKEQEKLAQRHGMSFDLIGVTDQTSYLIDFDGLDPNTVLDEYRDKAQAYEDGVLWLSHLTNHGYDEIVVIDMTASHELATHYVQIAEHGYHLISANKRAGASPTPIYKAIKSAFEKTGRYWFSNATVGGGLPINYAVRDLNASGDEIHSLSGIFSGTLSWLFLQYDGSVPFTYFLEQAWQQGLTESDPRVDLTGKDVKRKLIILAREAGIDIEPDSIHVESLVPDEYLDMDLDDFFDEAELLNQQMEDRIRKAQQNQQVLRYMARLDKDGNASVRLEALPDNHALAGLLPCDHIFAIKSGWYPDNPLVVRGPGSGRHVSAGAIQSDLHRLAQHII